MFLPQRQRPSFTPIQNKIFHYYNIHNENNFHAVWLPYLANRSGQISVCSDYTNGLTITESGFEPKDNVKVFSNTASCPKFWVYLPSISWVSALDSFHRGTAAHRGPKHSCTPSAEYYERLELCLQREAKAHIGRRVSPSRPDPTKQISSRKADSPWLFQQINRLLCNKKVNQKCSEQPDTGWFLSWAR